MSFAGGRDFTLPGESETLTIYCVFNRHPALCWKLWNNTSLHWREEN